MKKTIEQYFCDICGNEIKYSDYRWVKTGGCGTGYIHEFNHVCKVCYGKIDKCIKGLANGAN